MAELRGWWEERFGCVQVRLDQIDRDFVAQSRLATIHARVVEQARQPPGNSPTEVVIRIADGTGTTFSDNAVG